MKHIKTVLGKLRTQGKNAFIPYITAGDPDLSRTVEFLRMLESLGADMIEVGVPFSDPMADGPVIQAAMERALQSKTTLRGTLEAVRRFKERSVLPIILMGYFNPFHAYDTERFAKDARRAGVNAVLTVDLPPEEAGEFSILLRKNGIAPIFLATELTDVKRMKVIGVMGRGFIYLVSVTGVTGEREDLPEGLAVKAKELKEATRLPVVLGFGISGPQMIRSYRKAVDGFVVGSAIVKRWSEATGDREKYPQLEAFVNGLAKECHGHDNDLT